MKKILLSIAIVTMLGLGASAQRGSDGFFSYSEIDGDRDISSPALVMPQLGIGSNANESAPLSGGLLVLTALGAGYMVAKRRKE